jgi:hypothetical protein
MKAATLCRRFSCRKTQAVFLLSMLCCSVFCHGQAAITTWQNGNARTGFFPDTILTPSNVSTITLKATFKPSDKGTMHGQPLYVPNVTFSGKGSGTHNAIFVLTEDDYLYAVDADTLAAIYSTQILPASGWTPASCAKFGNDDCGLSGDQKVGFTSTPVIDTTNSLLLAVGASTDPSGSDHYELFAINYATGTVEGHVDYTGLQITNQGTVQVLTPDSQFQRPALLLANGKVYASFGGPGDFLPTYHGWVVGYSYTVNGSTVTFGSSPVIFISTMYHDSAGEFRGAVWQGGAGPAADVTGNIFFETGNGSFSPASLTPAYAMSVLKLASSYTQGVVPSDFFAPWDEQTMSTNDLDVGSAGPTVLTVTANGTTSPWLLAASGKPGVLYLLNKSSLGGFGSGSDNVWEEVNLLSPQGYVNDCQGNDLCDSNAGVFGGVAFWNDTIYVAPVQKQPSQSGPCAGFSDGKATDYEYGYLYAYVFNLLTEKIPPTPSFQNTTINYCDHGAIPAVSANPSDNTTGLVWAISTNGTTSPPKLHAHKASDLTELWNSGTQINESGFLRFSVPMIVNGKVYVQGQHTIYMFGQ